MGDFSSIEIEGGILVKPVLCSGEILIDFISEDKGKKLMDSETFKKRPGGSPFNIAVGISRLGTKVSFLGKLGKDPFSNFLMKVLESEGIDTSNVVVDERCKTTLAFVARDERGNPDFVFFRENPADSLLKIEEVKIDPSEFSLYHFGSISILEDPSRTTYMTIMEKFYEKKIPISFDPNVRPNLIKNRKHFLEDFHRISSHVDILKMSYDDLVYITQEKSLDKALDKIKLKDDTIIFITLGEQGCFVQCREYKKHIPAFKVREIDATGCGDAFMAAVIHKYLENKPESFEDIVNIGKFANAVSAIVLTKVGGANSMPYIEEVTNFLENYKTLNT